MVSPTNRNPCLATLVLVGRGILAGRQPSIDETPSLLLPGRFIHRETPCIFALIDRKGPYQSQVRQRRSTRGVSCRLGVRHDAKARPVGSIRSRSAGSKKTRRPRTVEDHNFSSGAPHHAAPGPLGPTEHLGIVFEATFDVSIHQGAHSSLGRPARGCSCDGQCDRTSVPCSDCHDGSSGCGTGRQGTF